jgi:translation initiation factor eIF-2B subunit alpha
LRDLNIKAALIADSAIGFRMPHIDMVFVGAECIFVNSGIVNQMGTFPIAVLAKTFNKPFYCVATWYFCF